MQYKIGICSECGKEIKPIKRKSPKPTGERELFMAIWAIQPHSCTNCKVYLGEEPKTFFFAHIKGKGANPELRLQPSNIRLLCFECHRIYDQGTKQHFINRGK